MLIQNISGFDNYQIIPKNKERIVSLRMTKNNPLSSKTERDEEADRRITLIFKDSLSFLCGSLDKNTELLVKSNHKFPYLSKSKLLDGKNGKKKKELLKLLCRKGKIL